MRLRLWFPSNLCKKRGKVVQKDRSARQPRALLCAEDFQTIQRVLEAYILYLKELKQESRRFQELYTRVEVVVVQIAGGNAQTLYLSHEELTLLLRAVLEMEDALQEQSAGDPEQYRPLMMQKVAGVRACLLAALPSAKPGDRAQLN
jgi:hypothetical protein